MFDVDPALLVETAERAELRGILRDLFAKAAGPAEAYDRMATEIGVPGLVIPPEYGGAGFGFADLAVVLEEAGRALLAAPLLSTTVLATHALLLAGDPEACARYLPLIAEGTLTAAVAGFEDDGLRARREAGGWIGEGAADFVIDGYAAGLLLLAARTPAGLALFACDAAAPGVTRTDRRVLDPTRPQALIGLDRTPLVPIGPAEGVVERVLDIGRAGLACEQVGGSLFAFDATLAHVRERTQFGRAIGSFQAVKHRLADLLVEIEAARSAAAYAVACVTAPPADLAVAASAAMVVCSAACRRAAAEYVQLSGGIGFTWEHPAHRYVRRASSSEVLFGTAGEHLGRLAVRLGL